MYRKILITTDGSAVSKHTACAGVKFAQQMGAEVLALSVAPEYQYRSTSRSFRRPTAEDEYVETMERTAPNTGPTMRAARTPA
jgi:nucleotide-binding universal stress UspA family protein